MGRPVKRHRFKFLCFGIVLLGVALSPLLVPGLSGGSQRGGSPGPIPASPWPPAIRNATIGTLPTMGWNSWNHFACGIDETLIKQIADAMVNGGLQAAGYDVVTLDACWSARNRDAAGNLSNDPQTFPSGMKALGDYIHARGLRFGLYASIGTRMCGDVGPGSLDHEVQDVATLASWGVDYIKADRCSADGLVMKDLYARWRDAIAVSGRPIVLSASDNIAVQEPWAWGPVTAHQWRMSDDIRDDWTTMMGIFDLNFLHAAATAPGGFNDPDMLEVGNGGMSETEYETHFGLWALMSAPLIAGNDVRTMDASTRAILTNPEVIAVDQDPNAFQAIKVHDNGAGQEVWSKPLASSGSRAVGLLNRGGAAATIGVDWATIGLAPGSATVRDLEALQDRGSFIDSYNVSVPAHGLALLRILGTDRAAADGYLSDQPWTYMANENGPVERDMSNGGSGVGDGRALSLNGSRHAKGLGTWAPSAMEFRPDGSCSTFTAVIGIDDEVGSRGSVIFQVWGDGRKIFDSGVMTGTTPAQNLQVDLSGIRSLRLETVAVDGTSYDSGDWADALLGCSTSPNLPPRASFTVSSNSVRPGDPVTFDATASTDPDGTIQSYAWDFGDGSTASGPLAGHSFAQAGTFNVVLTVTDNGGASNTATAAVSVTSAPRAAFSASPRAVLPGVPIRFDGSNSTVPGGHIVLYAWDFADGATAQGKVVTHAYSSHGIFSVRLLVKDNFDRTNETQLTIAVGNRAPTITSTSPSVNSIQKVGELGTFTIAASDPDGDLLSYSWTIDGVRVEASTGSYAFASMVPGAFALRVIATDGFAAVLFEWHVMVEGNSNQAPPPPTAGIPETVVSLGIVAVGLLVTLVTHAIRSRKGR